MLVVERRPRALHALREQLQTSIQDCAVDTASGPREAVSKAHQNAYALVLGDLQLSPDGNDESLTIWEHIRTTNPSSRILLLSPPDCDELTARFRQRGFEHLIPEGSKTETILRAARQALHTPPKPQAREHPQEDGDRLDIILEKLDELRQETGAQSVILANVKGQVIAYTGCLQGLDISTLVALSAGGFATSFEMSRCLGDPQAIYLNYHEGTYWDTYAANVGDDHYVLVIFDKASQLSRIGVVWLYTKRTIQQLLELTPRGDAFEPEQLFDEEFEASLSTELDSLFNGESGEERAAAAPTPGPAPAMPAQPEARSALKETLVRYTQEFQKRTNIKVSLDLKALPERLPSIQEPVLFKIFQEAMHNVYKHANASRISIGVLRITDGIQITIHDDGQGFEPVQCMEKGAGLKWMHECVTSMGGRLLVCSKPKQGTTLRLHIPMEQHEPQSMPTTVPADRRPSAASQDELDETLPSHATLSATEGSRHPGGGPDRETSTDQADPQARAA